MARIIFEGCDKTGKTTLIKEICRRLQEPHLVMKFSAPPSNLDANHQKTMQIRGIVDGITALTMFDNIILDRFSGGEFVYAPLKRGYSGEYIFRYELEIPQDTLLVVLTADDDEILRRFDHDFITEEEIPIVNKQFKEYYNRTPIVNKILIDTSKPIAECIDKIMHNIIVLQKLPKTERKFGRLEEMFMKQTEFQKMQYPSIDPNSLGYKFNQQYLTIQTLAAMVELGEFIQETPWKPWKKTATLNQEKAKEELVDVWHFVINLALGLDMTSEDLYQAFMAKNRTNFKRQETGY